MAGADAPNQGPSRRTIRTPAKLWKGLFCATLRIVDRDLQLRRLASDDTIAGLNRLMRPATAVPDSGWPSDLVSGRVAQES
jgi:hypothetical protein